MPLGAVVPETGLPPDTYGAARISQETVHSGRSSSWDWAALAQKLLHQRIRKSRELKMLGASPIRVDANRIVSHLSRPEPAPSGGLPALRTRGPRGAASPRLRTSINASRAPANDP